MDLSDNAITFLPNALPNLQSVTYLNLAHNEIQEITMSSLTNLRKLNKLDVSSNKMTQIINIQAVVQNTNLYTLNLSSNPIRDLGNSWETILHSDSVSHLDISNCAISIITNQYVFRGLTNLTHLNLSNNPIKIIDRISSLTLSHLDISKCNLYYLRETAFLDLPNLQDLIISKNYHLTMLSRYQETMSTSLLYIDASFCVLDKVDLHGYPNLIQASLKGNLIKVLPDRILQNNKELISLDLSQNSIHEIDAFAFTGAVSLFILDLSSNFIKDFYWSTFTQTPYLTHLNLSRNILNNLRNITAPSLSVLDASHCEIQNLDSTSLANVPELIYLNLSHNSIEELPIKLQSYALQNLDLSYCRISSLNEETFQYLPSLQVLDLTGNRLTTPIKNTVLNYLSNIIELKLVNNPWQCYCNNTDFVSFWRFLSGNKKRTKYLNELNCQSPENISGINWKTACFTIQPENRETQIRDRPWLSFVVTFVTMSCIFSIMIVIRQAITTRELERRELEGRSNRQSCSPILMAHNDFRPRIAPRYFEDDVETIVRLSENETQMSHRHEVSQLPTYEEALLLPKPSSNKNLLRLVEQYETASQPSTSQESSDNHMNSTGIIQQSVHSEQISANQETEETIETEVINQNLPRRHVFSSARSHSPSLDSTFSVTDSTTENNNLQRTT